MRERAEAARQGGEDGAGVLGRGFPDALGGVEQRAVGARGGGDRRHRRVEGEPFDEPGVHAAEQGLDEAVDDLAAEAGPDVVGDGHVGAARRLGQDEVERDARQPGRGQHPRGRQRPQVGRDAHDLAGRERTQPAAAEDGGGGGPGVHEVVAAAEFGDQVEALGAAGEHRLGALVHGEAGDLADPQLAADPRRALEDGHPHAGAGEKARGGEPRDPASDDDGMGRAHVSSLPDARQDCAPARVHGGHGGATASPGGVWISGNQGEWSFPARSPGRAGASPAPARCGRSVRSASAVASRSPTAEPVTPVCPVRARIAIRPEER